MEKEKTHLVEEMVLAATHALANHETAVKAIRALCKWYGGQQIYFPKTKLDGSEIGEEILGIMSDAVGGADGACVMASLMPLFGGVQLYIPFEIRAFRKAIAREIHKKFNGTGARKAELCREYGISFTQMYRMYHEIEAERRQPLLDIF